MSTVIRAEDLCVTLKIPRRPEKELVRHVTLRFSEGNALESWENREAEKHEHQGDAGTSR